MKILDEALARLLGFKGYMIPRETLYATSIVLAILLTSLILLPYDKFILLLAFTLPVLMLPLLALPLVYKSRAKVYRRAHPGLAGSSTNIELIVQNESNVPIIIAIEDYSKSLEFYTKHIVEVDAKSTEKIVYNVRGRVGRHKLYSKTVVYDPLNIIGTEKKDIVEGDDSVRFKPRILDIKGIPSGYFTQIVSGGGFRSNLKGLGYDFHGLRKYVYGDPIKLVDWKTSARQRELFVKEYILETGTRVLLALLLTDKSFMGKSSFFEEAAEALVSVINKLLVGGNSVGLVVGSPSYNGLVEVGQGKIVLRNAVEVLSNVPWLNDGSPNLDLFAKNIIKASKYPKNTKLVLVLQSTNSIEKEFYERVLKLREAGFESISLILVGETIEPYPKLYVLLEKKGVKITKLEKMDRELLAKKIIEILGRR